MRFVGSTNSSDLSIKVVEKKGGNLKLNNLVPEIDDEILIKTLTPLIKKYKLENYEVEIFYNGANKWVIDARLEAISHL